MRALAQYVMRGRTQAMLVTLISAGTVMFYWIGGAALALVTLRQGTERWVFAIVMGFIARLNGSLVRW